jgi:hypothetical protein
VLKKLIKQGFISSMPITRSQVASRETSSSTSDSQLEVASWLDYSHLQPKGGEREEWSELFSPTTDTSGKQEIAMVVTQRARFQYKIFRGKGKEDPNAWLEDFVGTAQANGKFDIRLTTLARVLRGEAWPWFNALLDATKNDWADFQKAFLQEFRKVGEEFEALIKMGEIRLGSKEFVRRFCKGFRG